MVQSGYAINREGVAHELLEGEAILINFKTGSYYSLDGLGGAVWEQLCRGPVSAASLTEALAPSVPVDATALHGHLVAFLDDLAGEELILRTDDPLATLVVSTLPYETFAAPVLQKYTDLEALLLLDPIHDVVVSGWPNAKQSPA